MRASQSLAQCCVTRPRRGGRILALPADGMKPAQCLDGQPKNGGRVVFLFALEQYERLRALDASWRRLISMLVDRRANPWGLQKRRPRAPLLP